MTEIEKIEKEIADLEIEIEDNLDLSRNYDVGYEIRKLAGEVVERDRNVLSKLRSRRKQLLESKQ